AKYRPIGFERHAVHAYVSGNDSKCTFACLPDDRPAYRPCPNSWEQGNETGRTVSVAKRQFVYFGLIVPLFSVKPCHYNS
ncbi:MAG: hypothetical protein WBI55_09000, partial [Eubacteriales bacterium]